MKIRITELRDMVAEAVRRTLDEAPKKPLLPHSDETEMEVRARAVKALPGYSHSDENDFSNPLGPNNIVKRQGASGMGGWTSESIRRQIKELQMRKLIRMIVGEEVQARRGRR